MSPAPLGLGPRRTALVLTAAALLLGGCGGQEPAELQVSSGHGRPVAASSTPSPVQKPARKTAAPATAASQEASLPPGDPGLDAPSMPDPGAGSGGRAGQDQGRRTVPPSALLTAGTVRMLAGSGWERRPGGGDECVRLEGARGLRSMTYGGTDAGVLVETVATYRDDEAADAAVSALAGVATGCGWEAARDPRLGSASVAARDGGRSMVAVSSEGVAVLLVGSGHVARDLARWGSLVDLALGTSCPAAPDGCH